MRDSLFDRGDGVGRGHWYVHPAGGDHRHRLNDCWANFAGNVRYERERVDAWIRNRLIAYPLASCFGCRKPIVVGAAWEEVSNGDTNARARFHRACHVQWRAGQEAAARQALGLEG